MEVSGRIMVKRKSKVKLVVRRFFGRDWVIRLTETTQKRNTGSSVLSGMKRQSRLN